MSAPRKSRRSLGPKRSVAVAQPPTSNPADAPPVAPRPSPTGVPLFVPQPTGYRYKGFSPWPCTPLQQGTMIMALVDAVFVLIRIIYALIWIIDPLVFVNRYIADHHRDVARTSINFVTYPLTLVHFLIELEFIAAAILLFFGAKNKNKIFCYVYLAIHAVHFPIEFFLGVYKINAFWDKHKFDGIKIGGDEWAYFIFLAYVITVVVFFLLELRTNSTSGVPSDQNGVIRPKPHQPALKALSRHTIKK